MIRNANMLTIIRFLSFFFLPCFFNNRNNKNISISAIIPIALARYLNGKTLFAIKINDSNATDNILTVYYSTCTILKINGKDYNASQMNDAVKVMKGKPNTDVKLTIARMENKTSKIFDVNITRRMISLTTVNSQKIGDIGYINITQFDRKTDKEFIEQYENLKKQNVKSIVLDLRNNPGGLLDSTVKIADYLLPQGVIVKTVDKNKKEDVQKSDASEQNLPMVVLVNGSSASASEILTGALKDYKKATIVGEKTFGKGIVQTIIPMDKGEGLKLTISEYFSPNGNKIHKQGVKPDVEIKLDEKAKGIGVEFMNEDNQLQKALEILNKK